jgi:hypothetical protein
VITSPDVAERFRRVHPRAMAPDFIHVGAHPYTLFLAQTD